MKLFDLSGKVALITGGSKGLGKEMARGLAEAGADIIITSRDENELKSALKEIFSDASISAKGTYIVADMTNRDDVSRLAKEAVAYKGYVDILINNAGNNIPETIDSIHDKNFDSVIELDLRSVMAITRDLVPQMKSRGWGRIITISSIMGFMSVEGRTSYSAAKAGVVGMTHAWAVELGKFGITANCIAPGPFLTDLPARVLTPEQKKRMSDHTVVGRWGNPKEIIGPALLLASDAGSYITGECIMVDGGYTIN